MQSLAKVWVTLKGERVHVQPDCIGILDGHAKARSEGRNTYEPELWPVHLALDGKPDGHRRLPCERCCSAVDISTVDDDAADVRAVQRGRIWRTRFEYARRLAQGQLQGPPLVDADDPGQTVAASGPDERGTEHWVEDDLDEIASMWVPLDAEDGESFYA